MRAKGIMEVAKLQNKDAAAARSQDFAKQLFWGLKPESAAGRPRIRGCAGGRQLERDDDEDDDEEAPQRASRPARARASSRREVGRSCARATTATAGTARRESERRSARDARARRRTHAPKGATRSTRCAPATTIGSRASFSSWARCRRREPRSQMACASSRRRGSRRPAILPEDPGSPEQDDSSAPSARCATRATEPEGGRRDRMRPELGGRLIDYGGLGRKPPYFDTARAARRLLRRGRVAVAAVARARATQRRHRR